MIGFWFAICLGMATFGAHGYLSPSYLRGIIRHRRPRNTTAPHQPN